MILHIGQMLEPVDWLYSMFTFENLPDFSSFFNSS
jgi:hypothetical protein